MMTKIKLGKEVSNVAEPTKQEEEEPVYHEIGQGEWMEEEPTFEEEDDRREKKGKNGKDDD